MAEPIESERSAESKAELTTTWHMDERHANVFLAAEHLGRRRLVTKGSTLYRQRDISSVFHFVLKGRIQVSVFQQDGTVFILEVMGPWSICGEGAAIDSYPRIASAVALEDCELIEFDFNRIQQEFATHPDLAVALLHVVATKQRVLGMKIQFMAMSKPELRIGELLARLSELYGKPDEEGIFISILLTHEQIAAMTGTSRVTVTRALTRLRQEGVITNRGRRFWVLDKARLCI